MKKIFVIILLFATGHAFSQSTYYDAIELDSIVTRIIVDVNAGKFAYPNAGLCNAQPGDWRCLSYSKLVSILKNHAPDNIKNQPDVAVIQYYIQNNPYFAFLPNPAAVAGMNTKSLITKAVSSLGGLDVTTIADGVAQFLVERTKEELNVAFFEKLKALLTKYPEFNVLFPNTQVFMNSFESWQYAGLLNTLRESFDKDFKQLLTHLVDLKDIDPGKCPEKSNDCKERITELKTFLNTNAGRLMLSALKIGDGLNQNQKLPDVLNRITTSEFLLGYTGANQVDFINTSQLINILSLSLRSNQATRHYISQEEFKTVLINNSVRNFYLGLLYQDVLNKNIVIQGVNVANILRAGNGVIAYLTQLQNQSVEFQRIVIELEAKRDTLRQFSDYVRLFDTANKLFQSALNVQLIDQTIIPDPEVAKMFGLTTYVIQIAHDVAIRNYNAAIISVLKLINDRIDPASPSYGRVREFSSSFLTYASFGANVVNADSPEEVKQAIKAVAQPSGSSSIKKNTTFNVALGAYVGFVYGEDVPSKKEYTMTDENGVVTKVKLNGGRALAVYAPIGVSLSAGRFPNWKNPFSATLFLSVLDLGALVGYRFTNDSTASVNTEVKLANIFAPGANIAIGIPGVPISIGYGFQWIPSLQRNPGDNALYKVDYSGMRNNQFFISVDIPLINFHTSKKNMLSRKRR